VSKYHWSPTMSPVMSHRRIDGHRKTRLRGMTLIEIMIVVAIIGILLAVVVPPLFGSEQDAKQTLQKTALRSVANGLEMYRLNNNHYPSTNQGLEALVSQPSGFPEPKNWRPVLRPSQLVDVWGNEYVYISDGPGFDLMSLGADGQEGGEGYDADITYAEL